jgi:lysophospholipase L1-like esterase
VISANQLLADRPGELGESPLTRFEREVAAVPGVTDVILHIGTNDVAVGRGSAEIIDGMVRFAQRARAAGKRVFLTTITPADDAARRAPAAVEVRATVNDWVLRRGREHADGVFDFAAAVADPARPTSLLDRYDAGDGLHLSGTGYRALAAAVDAQRLTGSPCLAGGAAGIAVAGN